MAYFDLIDSTIDGGGVVYMATVPPGSLAAPISTSPLSGLARSLAVYAGKTSPSLFTVGITGEVNRSQGVATGDPSNPYSFTTQVTIGSIPS